MSNEAWVISSAGLNLRDAPGGNFMATVPNGARVTTSGAATAPDANGNVWQQVRTIDNRLGWVASIIQGTATLSTTSAIESSAGRESFSITGTPSNDRWVIADNGVNLRDRPGGNFISALAKGAHLSAIGSPTAPDANNNVFQQVQTDDNKIGFVVAILNGDKLLSDTQSGSIDTSDSTTRSTTGTLPTATTEVWIISDNGLNFRDKPGGTLIATLPNGAHLTALGAANPPDVNGTVFQQVKTDDGQTGYVASLFQGEKLLTTTKPIAPTSAVPWGKCLAGLGMADQRPFTLGDLDVIRKSKIEAFKIITLGDADETKTLVSELKKINPNMLIVARLFFSTHEGNKFTADQFIDFCRVGLNAAYDAGVEYFEVHNEPNLPDEGFDQGKGGNWKNGAEFGTWLTQVLNKLRGSMRYPKAKWGYPGLSPQFGNTFDSETFLNGSTNAVALCDWIAVHCYWQTVNGPIFPMTGSNDGMYWKHFRDKFPNKLLMVTEFSNNRNQPDGVPTPTTDVDKGNQYAQYYRSLRHENNLGAAFAFALSWQDQDKNGEGWIFRNNGRVNETKIGSTLGASIAASGLG
jgi:hypothetical protein